MGFIDDRRRERQLTWEGLARVAGVSKQTLFNAEQGRGDPTTRTRRKIEEALGVPRGWFDEETAKLPTKTSVEAPTIVAIVPDGPTPSLHTARERQLWQALEEIEFSYAERVMHLNFFRVTHPDQPARVQSAQSLGQPGEGPPDSRTAG